MNNTFIEETTNADFHIEQGKKAEQKVEVALSKLPKPWQYFSSVEWRNLSDDKEQIGESDCVIFHPHYGVIIVEIKSGSVYVKEGKWFYMSGKMMKMSPFAQARRNRYALTNRLEKKLKTNELDNLIFTYAVWFPDIHWNKEAIGTDCPSREFILDRDALNTPEEKLLAIFKLVNPKKLPVNGWQTRHESALRSLLAPDMTIHKPLAVDVDHASQALEIATEQQIRALALLRTQKRLLIEGGAGSGKTRLALTLAQQHVQAGKRVLFTCFNKQLAQYIASSLENNPDYNPELLNVFAFHELAKHTAVSVGLDYKVPEDNESVRTFFLEQSPELLLNAASLKEPVYDTIIVDEANDFYPTWWIALEALGKPDFNWYCFYDRQQILYVEKKDWSPPFQAEAIILEDNLRNTRPIGEFAALQANYALPKHFRVEEGVQPEVISVKSREESGKQLNALLNRLIKNEYIEPEKITILCPYRCNLALNEWQVGLKGFDISEKLAESQKGKIRIGTIQSFKGLESDVVILFGMNSKVKKREEILYVGCSRAKTLLFLIDASDE